MGNLVTLVLLLHILFAGQFVLAVHFIKEFISEKKKIVLLCQCMCWAIEAFKVFEKFYDQLRGCFGKLAASLL